VFSDKSKAADAEWKIETFKQGRKHIADFMIEFEALAMNVKIIDSGLYFSYFIFFTLLFFFFFFLSSIFRTTWVRFDQSHCHISHKVDSVGTRTDHRTWENEVEGSGIK